mmetsp:Transcript_11156/g.15886  ORF Transcript_11156/g.15886 Transcript_11156/m.15886 type:complete len:184 (+) Transcript_11156:30-581(+)
MAKSTQMPSLSHFCSLLAFSLIPRAHASKTTTTTISHDESTSSEMDRTTMMTIYIALGSIFIFLIVVIVIVRCSPLSVVITVRSNEIAHRSSTNGLTTQIINRIPTVKIFNQSSQEGDAQNFSDCAISLMEFREGDTVRVLQDCSHQYHKECLDEWLLKAAVCPLCKSRVVPVFVEPKRFLCC